MKKIIFLAAAFAFATLANAQTTKTTTHEHTIQTSDVPVVVVTKFQTAYPAVTTSQWSKMGTYYMVDYSENNGNYYVIYNPTGEIIETGQGVEASGVPSSLNTYVKTKYKDEKMVKYYKVKDAKGKTIWKGKVEQGYLIFDENGNYIKMEKD